MSKRQLEWILVAVLAIASTWFWFRDEISGYSKQAECVRVYRTALDDIKTVVDGIDVNTDPENMDEAFVKRLWGAQTRVNLLIKEPPCGKPNFGK